MYTSREVRPESALGLQLHVQVSFPALRGEADLACVMTLHLLMTRSGHWTEGSIALLAVQALC